MKLEFYESDDTVIGILKIRLVIPSACNLKEKRRVIKSLKDRIKHNFNVSIAETGALENCQYSKIGVAMVGNSKQYVKGALSTLVNFFQSTPAVRLIDYQLTFV